MITDDTYQKEEEQLAQLFHEVGWSTPVEPNQERIEAITERAHLETVLKDATSFVFLGFTEVILNFLSVFFSSIGDRSDDKDYKA
ncbi:MAG: hypothetical protein ACQKBY_13695 [Verrucomicrobiales bacterium]